MAEALAGGTGEGAALAALPLRSERLELRAYRPADMAAIARLLDDAAMAELLMVIPQPFVPYDAQTLIRAAARRLATGRGLDLAVVPRDGPDEPVGGVGISLFEDGARAELGFWIGRAHWGRGYAVEAAGRLVAFAREALGIDRFTATAAADNAASIRVLEKLGFAECGRGEQEVPTSGELRAVIHFSREAEP